MLINKIAEKLYTSGQNVVNIMKRKLGETRSPNKLPMNNTFKTANSISALYPYQEGNSLKWEFVAEDSAVRLNTGGGLSGQGDVPYSGKSGKASGQKSQYIEALTNWAIRKYAIDPYTAKRMAFAIAHTAVQRGRVVGATGWLDDAKKELDKQIMGDISSILNQEINKFIMKELKY